ncbi:MAG: ComF family protein [Syntrophorhabdaceae bacterium]|nr:ComF family protein [Syntrophorhabdaceae bacterium]
MRPVLLLVDNLIKSILQTVYHHTCASCGEKGDIICKACRDSFLLIDHKIVCPLCGRYVGQRLICGECMSSKRYFSEGYFGFLYENKLREAIHTFKFKGRAEVGRYLISLIKHILLLFGDRVDLIVPIPITDKRLKERGFNQSYVISWEISKIIGKPVIDSALIKVRETNDQYLLSKEERKRNIKGAFALKKADIIKGKTILLVDDLYTTGYTANEASYVLSKGKPDAVILFALARTP